MRLYAITDRKLFAGSPEEQSSALLAQSAAWTRGRVEWIQLREKDLASAQITDLAGRMVEAVRREGGSTRVVVNGSAAIAVAAGADGVHLPAASVPAVSDDLERRMDHVRDLCGPAAFVSVSCHTPDEAAAACMAGASVILFAPVFEKPLWGERRYAEPDAILPGVGLALLQAACAIAGEFPVYALGGVTPRNAEGCIAAGAAGVAGIRLFAGEGWLRLR